MDKDNLKGGKDMETTIKKIQVNVQQCPFCNQKPSSFGADALKYNYKVHLDKHLRRGEITQEELDNAMKRLIQSISENAN
jgi:hypothetical protein